MSYLPLTVPFLLLAAIWLIIFWHRGVVRRERDRRFRAMSAAPPPELRNDVPLDLFRTEWDASYRRSQRARRDMQ